LVTSRYSCECFICTPPHGWLPFLKLTHCIFPDSRCAFSI